ncbi:MAG: hypothetical protein VX986_03285 [Pseudomonadota bacterium]|nr:hypothetical protein [Pseudomonadota bacterium]
MGTVTVNVTDTELKGYLDDTMSYYARRYYGRDQDVQIINGRESLDR